MNRLRLTAMLLCLLPLVAAAQPYLGYLSYRDVLLKMPEYEQVQKDLADLRAQYEAEAQRGEAEFQKKFVEFLQGQKDFPQTIMLKRQTELQSLMDNGVEFRHQMQNLLQQAEKDLLQPVNEKLHRAIQEVGQENRLMCILNTDGDNLPYLSSEMAVDVTILVTQKLSTIEAVTPDAEKEEPTEAAPVEAEAAAEQP